MSPLSTLLLWSCLLWLLLFIIHRRRRSRLLSDKDARRPLDGGRWASLEVKMGLGWVNLDTRSFNHLPMRLTGTLGGAKPAKQFDFGDESRGSSRLAKVLGAGMEVGYGVGAVVAVVGVGVASVVLLRAAAGSVAALGSLLARGSDRPPGEVARSVVKRMVKRAVVPPPVGRPPAAVDGVSPSERLVLRPLLPGHTMSLAQVAPLVLAVIVSQGFHELGHGMAAALDHLDVLSCGLYLLFPFLPIFYVSLPTADLAQLPARSRLRIASAGVWHNLVLAALAWAFWDRGMGLAGEAMARTFWRDVGGEGRLVTSVSTASPLNGILEPGSVVTRLDDFALDVSSRESSPADPWSRYLLERAGSGDARYDNLGWCVDWTWLAALPARCCTESDRSLRPGICLVSEGEGGEGLGCISGPELGTLAQARSRCVDGGGCGSGEACVRPRRADSIVRIAVKRRSGKEEPRVVIFQGHRRRLYAQVRVSALSPEYRFVPFGLAPLIEESFGLVVSVCLALMFLNLLPVSMLDGSAIVDSFLACLFSLDPGGILDGGDSLENGLGTIGHARPLHHRRDRPGPTDILGRFIGLVRGKIRPRSHEAVASRHLHWRNVSKNVQRVSTGLAGFVFVSAFVVELID